MKKNLAHHIFLLVICLFSSIPSVGKPVANADSLLKWGEKDYYNELYSDAVDKYLKCIEKARNDGDDYHEAYALCEIGMVYT